VCPISLEVKSLKLGGARDATQGVPGPGIGGRLHYEEHWKQNRNRNGRTSWPMGRGWVPQSTEPEGPRKIDDGTKQGLGTTEKRVSRGTRHHRVDVKKPSFESKTQGDETLLQNKKRQGEGKNNWEGGKEAFLLDAAGLSKRLAVGKRVKRKNPPRTSEWGGGEYKRRARTREGRKKRNAGHRRKRKSPRGVKGEESGRHKDKQSTYVRRRKSTAKGKGQEGELRNVNQKGVKRIPFTLGAARE